MVDPASKENLLDLFVATARLELAQVVDPATA
jgi:hypothetical protein